MTWQNQLKQSIRAMEQLKSYTEVMPGEEKQWQHVVEKHAMRITPYYLSLMATLILATGRPVKRVGRRFQVPIAEGCRIIEEAKRKLDGPSKRFRYVMSHRTGKVEILGVDPGRIYLKYYQARSCQRRQVLCEKAHMGCGMAWRVAANLMAGGPARYAALC